jgi:MSHA biogenesis protein MshL
MKPSASHVQVDSPVTSGTIPAPVQISSVIPKPRPALRPETYSVVVNNENAQELLFALARDAKLNVDVNAGIRGVVTLNAIDQTLPQLLSRIARQIDMRWELDGPNLIVMPDSPYLRVYKVDYLNMERSTTGTVAVSSQISTGATGSGGGGGGSGGGASSNTSTTTVQNRSSNKYWETLVGNIKDLLHETDKVLPGGQAQAAAAQPAAPAGAGAPPGQQVATAPAAANINFREAASVISNPEAGVLSIRATSRQHEKIQEFLDQVQSSAKRQVLIEATIAEVQLNNNYQRGIDWAMVRNGPGTLTAAQTAQGTALAAIDSSMLVLRYAAQGVGVTLRLLESFGNVRVLSSPKISVLNNQTAMLKVVDNRVYFTIQGQSTSAANVGTTTTFTTTPNVVPVGFIMNVTPQISDADTVLLNLKPAVTRIIGYVNDPNPSLSNPCGVGVTSCSVAPIVSRIPEIQTREMESMMKVNSGQIAVMGGLIQDSNSDNEDTIPGLFGLPTIGDIFSNRNRENRKTELVIFIRPIVVRDPSIDGDFRAFRDLAPDANFISRPNPGKPGEGRSRP